MRPDVLDNANAARNMQVIMAVRARSLLLRWAAAAAFPVLLLTILAGDLRGADNWVEVRNSHFTVVTNASEKDARKLLEQFELFRATFHSAFAALRVDQGPPIVILGAKNAALLKELLPEQYETKGHAKSVGYFEPGLDKDCVLVRMNADDDSAYHVLYHEYTHVLTNLNFSSLPLWLEEGLAEYLGHADLSQKQARIGMVDVGDVYLLRENRLIPIETLLSVDRTSPYYNEANRTSMFYAESWALVHYLMLDPDARRQQLLSKFLQAWSDTGDQIQAARTAFGDLKKFSKTLEAYVGAGSFYAGILKPATEPQDLNFTSRSVPSAEALAYQADFLTHRGRLDKAKPLLDEALKESPNDSLVHENLGLYHFYNHDLDAADAEMQRAIQFGAVDFEPYYFHGFYSLSHATSGSAELADATASLKKAIQLNPRYAPSYDALAHAYSLASATLPEAITLELQADKLDPSQFQYETSLTSLLLAGNRMADARAMVSRLQRRASTQAERAAVENLAAIVSWRESHPDVSVMTGEQIAGGTRVLAIQPGPPPKTDTDTGTTTESGPPPAESTLLAPTDRVAIPMETRSDTLTYAEGTVSELNCGHKPHFSITISFHNALLTFENEDADSIVLRGDAPGPAPAWDTCSKWVGRKVKVGFNRAENESYLGIVRQLSFADAAH
jgi:tetratricopeptide (TPR) repeat protein